jgi:hypothetical protein
MLKNRHNLKARLHKFTELIAQEAERNQEFAKGLADILGITGETSTQRKQNRSRNEVDPFDVLVEKGIDGLKIWLGSLDIDMLRSIVRQHSLDSSRLSDKWKNKERFVELICERVHARSRHGDSFRRYGQENKETPASRVGSEETDSRRR